MAVCGAPDRCHGPRPVGGTRGWAVAQGHSEAKCRTVATWGDRGAGRQYRDGGRTGGEGATLIRHARRLVLQMAEVAVPRDLFAQILTRIRLLSPVPT